MQENEEFGGRNSVGGWTSHEMYYDDGSLVRKEARLDTCLFCMKAKMLHSLKNV